GGDARPLGHPAVGADAQVDLDAALAAVVRPRPALVARTARRDRLDRDHDAVVGDTGELVPQCDRARPPREHAQVGAADAVGPDGDVDGVAGGPGHLDRHYPIGDALDRPPQPTGSTATAT